MHNGSPHGKIMHCVMFKMSHCMRSALSFEAWFRASLSSVHSGWLIDKVNILILSAAVRSQHVNAAVKPLFE